MEYTLQQKADRILEDIESMTGTDPVAMFLQLAQKDYISIHGAEHHVLDAACLLKAYQNAGGKLAKDKTFKEAFDKIKFETLRMPGAACGLWGVCGAVTALGSVLSVIDGTGPLSDDGTWGDHMKFTSETVAFMGKVNGPRCCKRDAFISFSHAIDYINEHYDVTLQKSEIKCGFSVINKQCIKERCPFHVND